MALEPWKATLAKLTDIKEERKPESHCCESTENLSYHSSLLHHPCCTVTVISPGIPQWPSDRDSERAAWHLTGSRGKHTRSETNSPCTEYKCGTWHLYLTATDPCAQSANQHLQESLITPLLVFASAFMWVLCLRPQGSLLPWQF